MKGGLAHMGMVPPFPVTLGPSQVVLYQPKGTELSLTRKGQKEPSLHTEHGQTVVAPPTKCHCIPRLKERGAFGTHPLSVYLCPRWWPFTLATFRPLT